jgi:hypothetical protein
MSGLGHSRPNLAVRVMSGLPPVATVGADIPVRQLRAMRHQREADADEDDLHRPPPRLRWVHQLVANRCHAANCDDRRLGMVADYPIIMRCIGDAANKASLVMPASENLHNSSSRPYAITSSALARKRGRRRSSADRRVNRTITQDLSGSYRSLQLPNRLWYASEKAKSVELNELEYARVGSAGLARRR